MRGLLRGLGDMWGSQSCLGQAVLLGLLSVVLGLGVGLLSIQFTPPAYAPSSRLAAEPSPRPVSSPSPLASATPVTDPAPSSAQTSLLTTSTPLPLTDTSLPATSTTVLPSATSLSPTADSSPTASGVPITATRHQATVASTPAAGRPTPTSAPPTPGSDPTSKPAPTAQPTGHRPSPTPELVLQGPPDPSEALRVSGTVVWAIDGDTIEVSIAGCVYRVKYLGCDTPDAGENPVGRLAAARNRQLVGGKSVHLERDVTNRDGFGQLLRYVFVGDLLVNAQLVRDGYAQAVLPPGGLKYAEQLREAAQDATDGGRQLWAIAPDGSGTH